MDWAPQQEAALSAVGAWLRDRHAPQVFKLFGYAGTGKTTMARHIADTADRNVLFAAYTGKAAHVLRSKGCANASTIHQLIYLARDKSKLRLIELEQALDEARYQAKLEDGTTNREIQKLEKAVCEEREQLAQPAFTLNRQSEVQHAGLVIIDECSMVDGRMGDDLLTFGTKVLVLGDPAQLPPVGGGGFFTNGEPDVMLTDIHRQAKDNPIIAMATTVRKQQKLKLGDYGSSRVIDKAKLDPTIPLGADQLLVGRNKTRHGANRRLRELSGFVDSVLPVAGDKVVCLRNNHDLGLLNGSLWSVDDSLHTPEMEERMYLTVRPMDTDMDYSFPVEIWTAPFTGQEFTIPWWGRKDAEEFDYGYALTVHKAQGSQWGNVVLFDESFVFRRDRWKWLYTGITRAADTVTVVDMG
jgi:exodeoxyribonuclease-5